MTWGTQNTATEGHSQIDRALERGVNFIDTAEMYPVNPLSAETTGRTEEIIGQWVAQSGRRSEVVLATKHSGAGYKGARDGAPISAQSIPKAIEGSLKRLQTDVIDLYQFHWPNRGSYMFRQNWDFDPSKQNRAETLTHMQEALGALEREVKRGTIRHFGLSNESAWGTAQWLRLSEENGGPRVASIQNEYSLMCRLYDTDLAELSVNENVGLLAFSPLAAGFLTGKYQGGVVPVGSRMSHVSNLGGRRTDRAYAAVDALSGSGTKAWAGAGADGVSMVSHAAFYVFGDFWSDNNGTVGPCSGVGQRGADGRSLERHRRGPPRASDAVLRAKVTPLPVVLADGRAGCGQ